MKKVTGVPNVAVILTPNIVLSMVECYVVLANGVVTGGMKSRLIRVLIFLFILVAKIRIFKEHIMIDNYLDFVKTERKRLLKQSRADYKMSATFHCEWLQGYYRGKALVKLCESWTWKRLQKDIEARNKDNQQVASVGICTGKVYDTLS